MIPVNQLRIGNYAFRDGILVQVDGRSIMDAEAGLVVYEGVPLTEDIMLKLRRVQLADFWPLEFSVTAPGERQVENNFWSGWINEDYRLHLSPSYEYNFAEGEAVKSSEIKFWFCWYHGTGSCFLPIAPINSPAQLKFVHQLQNIFQSITGQELEIKQ